MAAEDIQLNEWTPAPMRLVSAKQPWPIPSVDFSYNCRNTANVLPHTPWDLVPCTDFPSLKRHTKRVLLWGEHLGSMRNPCFPYHEQASHSQFIQPWSNCQFTNSVPKSSEASWFNSETNSMKVQQPQCLCAQESNPGLLPTQTFPLSIAQIYMSCLKLSEK